MNGDGMPDAVLGSPQSLVLHLGSGAGLNSTGIALSAALASPGIWGLCLMALATVCLFVLSRRKVSPSLQHALHIAMGVCFVFAGWFLGEISAIIPQNDPSQH